MSVTGGFSLRSVASQIGFGVLLVAALFWFVQARRVPTNVVAARDCENRYAEARTAADSLSVDQRVLVFADRSNPNRTCRDLRLEGRLQ